MFEFVCEVGNQAKNIRKFKEMEMKIAFEKSKLWLKLWQTKIYEICD